MLEFHHTQFLIHRFEALVEREWIQAGHPFRSRCSKSAYAITKQRQESPIFLLFLDSVWQVSSHWQSLFTWSTHVQGVKMFRQIQINTSWKNKMWTKSRPGAFILTINNTKEFCSCFYWKLNTFCWKYMQICCCCFYENKHGPHWWHLWKLMAKLLEGFRI